MSYLDLRLDKPYHKPINCFFEKKGGGAGPMSVVFMNDPHAHDGPYISFDSTIRGFRIAHQEFTPEYQDFEFKSNDKGCRLTCIGDGYEFSMDFHK